jgi:polysaccharide export outer membrane protein
MKNLRIFLFIIIVINSCTPYKQIPYFQDLKRNGVVSENITNRSPLTMQPGDLLGINVSSLNHEADVIYNNDLERQVTLDGFKSSQSTILGYLIDAEGNIELPIIGTLKVSGYTTKEISTQLESKLQVYLSKPTVNVRMLNFKISVLGDVKNPGSFNIQNETVTFPEALGLAGDLNSTGIRNVLLIREKDADRQYINMDLTSKAIFTSPYYYLKNNDIIYVQPGRAKISIDRGGYQKVGIVLTALSIIVYLIRRN